MVSLPLGESMKPLPAGWESLERARVEHRPSGWAGVLGPAWDIGPTPGSEHLEGAGALGVRRQWKAGVVQSSTLTAQRDAIEAQQSRGEARGDEEHQVASASGRVPGVVAGWSLCGGGVCRPS